MQDFNVVRTLRYDVETPLSSLATNKDANQVAVAGRNQIHVFHVDNHLRPSKLLCKVKTANVNRPTKSGIKSNFSISDIAWSTSDQSKLATASTNGSITVWNLARQLAEVETLAAHNRSVHKVLFCNDNCNIVLSASQDGKVKFFDMRGHGVSSNPSPIKELCSGRPSPIRDVQYSPYDCYHLAVANELGELQLWDVRNTKKPWLSITCHSYSITNIDWYPPSISAYGAGANIAGTNGILNEGCYGWIATACCRDHLIKVWEVKQTSAELIIPIKTSYVNRICWRKDAPQLASSSNLNIDLNIHLWDIKRPHLPYASFEGHTDLVTGIRWTNDTGALYSVGKDNQLIRHSLADAHHLVNAVSPIATDISPHGKVAYAARLNTFAVQSSAQTLQSPTSSKHNEIALTTSQKFNLTKSQMCQFSTFTQNSQNFGPCDGLDQAIFINLARNYKLSGDSVKNLCIYNSGVAAELGEYFLQNLWLIFISIYDKEVTCSSDSGVSSPISNKLKDSVVFSSNLRLEASNDKSLRQQQQQHTDSDTNKDKARVDMSNGNSDDQAAQPLTNFNDSINAASFVPINDTNAAANTTSATSGFTNIKSQKLDNLKLFYDPSTCLFIELTLTDVVGNVDPSITGPSASAESTSEQYLCPEIASPPAHRRLSDISEINVNTNSMYDQVSITTTDTATVQFGSSLLPNNMDTMSSTRGLKRASFDNGISLPPHLNVDSSDNDDVNRVNYLDNETMLDLSNMIINGIERAPYIDLNALLEDGLLGLDRRNSFEYKNRDFVLDSKSGIGADMRKYSREEDVTRNKPHDISVNGPLDLIACQRQFHCKQLKAKCNGAISHPLEMISACNASTTHNNTGGMDGGLLDYLQDLVDQDCVQTVCSLVIVLADWFNFNSATPHPKEHIMEMWFTAYIDMLMHYQLWIEACSVIKLCPLSAISNTSQQSTTVSTSCAKCEKKLEHNHSKACSRHASYMQNIVCCVCRLSIQGHFLWCHGCGHGGHLVHMTDWFSTRNYCPSGCGHRC